MAIVGRNSRQLCYWLLTAWVRRVSKSKDFRSCWNCYCKKKPETADFERMVMQKEQFGYTLGKK